MSINRIKKKKKVDTERWSTTQYLKENFDTCHNMNESYAK